MLPETLAREERWILSALVPQPDGKIKKPPVDLKDDSNAYPISYAADRHWRDFDSAQGLCGRPIHFHFGDTVQEGNIGPPGFAFGENGLWADDLQLVCLDLDDAVSETGDVHPTAGILLENFKDVAFIESSVSGRGYHIWTFVAGGVGKTKVVIDSLKIDIIARNGYVIVTGIGDGEIRNGTEQYNRLIKPATRTAKKQKLPTPPGAIDWGRVYAAVWAIDPDCGYDEWIQVLMGLESLNHEWAYDLALEWSALGEKFDGEGPFRAKWQSFHSDRGGITIATVFSLALQAGWDGKPTLEGDGPMWIARRPAPIRISVGREKKPKKKRAPGLVPPRGVLKAFYKRLEATSPLNTPGLFLGGALGAGAFLTENRFYVNVGLGPLSLNPYIFIAAGSGIGKNAVLNLVKDLKQFGDVSGAVMSGVQSNLALAQTMAEETSTFVMTDEAIDWLENAQVTGQQAAIIAAITQAYGNGRGLIPGIPGRQKPIPDAIDSALIPLLLGQPARLERVLSNDRLTSGFFPRFLMMSGQPQAIQEVQDPGPLGRDIETWQGWARRVGANQRIRLSGEAMEAYEELKHHELLLQLRDDARARYWSRSAQNTLIVSGLSAALSQSTQIEMGDWKFAERVVRRSIREWEELFATNPEGQLVDTRIRNGLLRFLGDQERIMKRARQNTSVAFRKVAPEGWVRFGDLRYGCSVKEIPAGVLERVVESLIREELIEEATIGTRTYYRLTNS